MLSACSRGVASDHRLSGAIRYREIDTGRDAAAAAELLRVSWTPPCLFYSDEYVTWQLSWGGAVRSRAIAAVAGSRIVGLIALVPRRIRSGGSDQVVYVLSFFAVAPEYRGEGIGAKLADLILAVTDRPTLIYTEPGASSERVLARAAISRGWSFRHVAELRTYACAAAGREADPAAAREATVDEFRAIVEACADPRVAWSQPAADHLQHYLDDPRGASLAMVQTPAGVTLGGALIVRSQVITARGVECVPSLDSVFLHSAPAGALRALRAFALARWRSSGVSVVTAPNLHGVDADMIRASGFRATRSAFNLAVTGERLDPVIRDTAATNLEVF